MLAILLIVAAGVLHPTDLLLQGADAAPSFAILAGVVGAGLAADHLRIFASLEHRLLRRPMSAQAAAAASLTFTAALSGLSNLDVAVVVTLPVALRLARREVGLDSGRLAVATALTANATSFLLPSSNVTTLLILSRSPLAPLAYIQQSWPAWLLVAAVTIAVLSWLASNGHRDSCVDGDPPVLGVAGFSTLLDLIPMFMAVAAVRAILGGGLVLGGGFVQDLLIGSGLAASVNNVPVAAALLPVGVGSRWAAILTTALGPNLFMSGSIASLLARRIAYERGASFDVRWFSIVGGLMLPLQLLVAWAGLALTGAAPAP